MYVKDEEQTGDAKLPSGVVFVTPKKKSNDLGDHSGAFC